MSILLAWDCYCCIHGIYCKAKISSSIGFFFHSLYFNKVQYNFSGPGQSFQMSHYHSCAAAQHFPDFSQNIEICMRILNNYAFNHFAQNIEICMCILNKYAFNHFFVPVLHILCEFSCNIYIFFILVLNF